MFLPQSLLDFTLDFIGNVNDNKLLYENEYLIIQGDLTFIPKFFETLEFTAGEDLWYRY
jgi:hypothetical protein